MRESVQESCWSFLLGIDECLQVEVWEVFVSYGLKDLVFELKAKNSMTQHFAKA